MSIQSYIGKHADDGTLMEHGLPDDGCGGFFVTDWEICLKTVTSRSGGTSGYTLIIHTDMNGMITGLSRHRFSDDDEFNVDRFPADVEKIAEAKLHQIIDPNYKALIGKYHRSKSLEPIESRIAKVLQSAQKRSRTAFRWGPFIFTSSSSGQAIMLAPVKSVFRYLGWDNESYEKISYSESSISVKMAWHGEYVAYTGGKGKGKKPEVFLILNRYWNGKTIRARGYPIERIIKLEQDINNEFPVGKTAMK